MILILSKCQRWLRAAPAVPPAVRRNQWPRPVASGHLPGVLQRLAVRVTDVAGVF